MLAVFFVIALVELLAVHLLVALWSPVAAWVLSALTLLALGQIAYLVHGMMNWPTLVDDRGITVRHGRRSEIFEPLGLVRSVEDVAFRPEEKGAADVPGHNPGSAQRGRALVRAFALPRAHAFGDYDEARRSGRVLEDLRPGCPRADVLRSLRSPSIGAASFHLWKK